MIIDQARIGGISAYLQDPRRPHSINLGGQDPGSGRTRDLGHGQMLNVNGIRFTIRGSELGELFTRSKNEVAEHEPLFSISLIKEIYPGLFADPFKHRVHTISGFEDLHRGVSVNCRTLEVEGKPTLVSTGSGEVTWTSPIYILSTETQFDSAAWDLPSARHASPNAFRYSISLRVWLPGEAVNDGVSGLIIPLVKDADPVSERFIDDLLPEFKDPATGNDLSIQAYQVIFVARVFQDALIAEQHARNFTDFLGRPLLRAVHLSEPIKSIYDFYSLTELFGYCSEYYMPQSKPDNTSLLTAFLEFPSALVCGDSKSESLEVIVHYTGFETFEAMLEATMLIRPSRG